MIPPIPAQLAHRPTVGGLVVPYISLRTDRGFHLGHVSQPRWLEVIGERRCQVCGEPLVLAGIRHSPHDRWVLQVRPSDMAAGYSAEPALHPVCAAYAAKACPMVAGRRETYRRTPLNTTARTCDLPDCRCEVLDSNPNPRLGAPAEPWLAVWCRPDQYTVAVGPDGQLAGLVIPKDPTRVRPISGTSAQALDLIKEAL